MACYDTLQIRYSEVETDREMNLVPEFFSENRFAMDMAELRFSRSIKNDSPTFIFANGYFDSAARMLVTGTPFVISNSAVLVSVFI